MHRYYYVNCSAVFAGDQNELKKIETLLKDPAEIRIPSDAAVADNWLGDCGRYKRYRDYPNTPLSKEEADFPIAYSIVVHKDAAQVERLFRSIYQPQNVYCIHVDLKSKPNFTRAIENLAHCFDNVFIASNIESVGWGQLSFS
ncbi:beta-1,3-galactosyl-O-glycosyl-glycoprotein beta-1,6-N-acetylglucosaminyltransferase-like [Amphiura filiformis]|uniref:beta-1,3-galactosyl-O-glycosyl-glycoprotein beta-1,6-N-acetylglucosaminyltransferase-like n=1 Tax=Amphiura filiformis TaxID=82378 RepID=UPI003B220641